MNRRDFGKRALAIASAAIIVPRLLAEPQDDFFTSLDGKLKVFEKARDGYDYSIGVETGYGIGSPSCFSVMRVGNENGPCVQAAEYYSDTQDTIQFAHDIAKVAGLYRAFCKDPRGPILVIEQVTAPGDGVQAMLKIMGLTRFFKTATKNFTSFKNGWYTTRFSGPILMDRFTEAVRNGWYKVNSVHLRCDMTTVGGTKYRAVRVRAAAQSYLAAQNRMNISESVANRLKETNPELSKRLGQKISEWFKANSTYS